MPACAPCTPGLRRIPRQAEIAVSILKEGDGALALYRRLGAKLTARDKRFQPHPPPTLLIAREQEATEVSKLPRLFVRLRPIAASMDGRTSRSSSRVRQALLTYTCLKSVPKHARRLVEVIVVDDASPDPTAKRFASVTGVRFERNAQNLGFIGTCNARRRARARRVPGVPQQRHDRHCGLARCAAATCSTRMPDAGLVGAKLSIRTAACRKRAASSSATARRGTTAATTIRTSPSTIPARSRLLLGRGLAIPRELFRELGGFDTRYAPAYYEDTDLRSPCAPPAARSYYQPACDDRPLRGQTSGTDDRRGIKRYQVVNQREVRGEVGGRAGAHRAERRRARARARPLGAAARADHRCVHADARSGLRLAAHAARCSRYSPTLAAR